MKKHIIALALIIMCLLTTLTTLQQVQAASTTFIPIKLRNGEPTLPSSDMNLSCKKNIPCFMVKNETKQKVYWWYRGLKPIPPPVTSIVFVGTILKPGESKTFRLNDQDQMCAGDCSLHVFRIWYDGLNHDGLQVHTY